MPVQAELCRLRLDKWRVVYTISEADLAIDVLAVRKRPPYDYGDLGALLAGV
jgi:mRNA interferase RelE/StbE